MENALPNSQDSGAGPGADQSAPAESPVSASAEPPVKRGPGRPKGSGTKAPPGITAEKPGAQKPAQDKPGKRGAKMSAEALGTLAKQIQGMHAMAAMMTGIPILAITPEESALLAGGISAVAEEYGLALDGKTGAALQLFGAAAMVYAPRILQIQAMKRAARANTVDVESRPVN